RPRRRRTCSRARSAAAASGSPSASASRNDPRSGYEGGRGPPFSEEAGMTARNRYGFRVGPAMRRGLSSAVPIPTRLVSNEEFPPIPQTPAQRRVEDRILADAARLAPRLGLSRRQFLSRSSGMAASLLAMNAVFGRFFDVLPVEAADPVAFQERSGAPVFIF